MSLTLVWWIFFRERIWYIIPNQLIQKHKKIPGKILWLWNVRFILITLLCAIIANTGELITSQQTKKAQQNILIILDISRSMLAEDIVPSRIEAAKSTIATFLNERDNDVFWLIVFAGKPFVSIPFSDDTSGIRAILENIGTYSIRQDLPWLSGTAIGDALLLANTTLSWTTQKKSIILITDGRANIGIDPLLAAEETMKLGIPIFTIAIGGTSNEVLSYTDPNTQKKIILQDELGNPLRSDIDEQLLKKIANITWWWYFRATQARELYEYLDNIDQYIKDQEEKITETRYFSYRPYLFVILILTIIIERIITQRIFYKNNRK